MLEFLSKRAKLFGANGMPGPHQTIIEAADLPPVESAELIQKAEIANVRSILNMMTTIALLGANGYKTLIDLYRSRNNR